MNLILLESNLHLILCFSAWNIEIYETLKVLKYVKIFFRITVEVSPIIFWIWVDGM